MSTYNGGLYLEGQIESILRQTDTSWKLLIRDDGSSDNTRKIILKYCQAYPERIFEVVDHYGNVGSSASFSFLLEQSTSKYIMFCDQDDVWLDNKIELTYKEIVKLEQQNEKLPLMVFTDLHVVNDDLKIINESFVVKQKLFPEVINNVHKILALNVVAGCTVMINDVAKAFILPFPKFMIHDHWIAINIVHSGSCKYLDRKTILYRQHENNFYGAFEVDFKYFFKKIIRIYKYLSILFMIKKRLTFRFSILMTLYYKAVLSFRRLL